MNKVLLLICLALAVSEGFSQEKEGDLRMEKAFGGVRFYEGDNVLKPKDVLNKLRDTPDALAEFKKAKSNLDAASALGFVGGFLIGWPLGTALGGGDPQWGLAVGGAGLLLLSIPLNAGFTKHANNAIKIYNHDATPASPQAYILQVVPYGTGAKVIFRF